MKCIHPIVVRNISVAPPRVCANASMPIEVGSTQSLLMMMLKLDHSWRMFRMRNCVKRKGNTLDGSRRICLTLEAQVGPPKKSIGRMWKPVVSTIETNTYQSKKAGTATTDSYEGTRITGRLYCVRLVLEMRRSNCDYRPRGHKRSTILPNVKLTTLKNIYNR